MVCSGAALGCGEGLEEVVVVGSSAVKINDESDVSGLVKLNELNNINAILTTSYLSFRVF